MALSRREMLLMSAGLLLTACSQGSGISAGQEDVTDTDATPSSQDRSEECIADISKGLAARWVLTGKDHADFAGLVSDVSEGVSAELEHVAGYQEADFADEGLASLITEYQDSLKAQIEGIEGYVGDAALYNERYVDQGHIPRSKCLSTLVEKYGLEVEDKLKSRLREALDGSPRHKIGVGETVTVETDGGDLDVRVEGMALNEADTNSAHQYGDGIIGEEQSIFVLLLSITNVSYDAYTGDFVDFGSYVWPYGPDESGYGSMDTSWERYPGYEQALSSFVAIPQGNTLKIAVPYALDSALSEVGVCVGDYFTYISDIQR